MHFHTVNLPPPKDANIAKVAFILHKARDYFWCQNASALFPTVVESIEEAFSEYPAKVEHINQKANSDTTCHNSYPHRSSCKRYRLAPQTLPMKTENRHLH